MQLTLKVNINSPLLWHIRRQCLYIEEVGGWRPLFRIVIDVKKTLALGLLLHLIFLLFELKITGYLDMCLRLGFSPLL